ncbi:ATP-binding protein [Nonomuraea rubra]|uniref:ATP-binding protein n=1 Tax=Nonomuraea rubra TaxID=46180 RepID=UPI00360C93C1
MLVEGRAGACDAVFPFHRGTALEPSCVATARRFVDQTLSSWGNLEHAFDAQLVVSELVTNAMRHGGGAAQLRLLSHEAELACVVTDYSHSVPVTAAPDVFSEYGRGCGWWTPCARRGAGSHRRAPARSSGRSSRPEASLEGLSRGPAGEVRRRR